MARFSTAFLSLFFSCTLSPIVHGQLKVLSAGNSSLQWKTTQLLLIKSQMEDSSVKGKLRNELEAQKQWLDHWEAGTLSEQPTIEQTRKTELFSEPTIDPQKKATALRQRLMGKGAKPTSQDTNQLQAALEKSPNDLGLRQLYMHWLDQRQYRDEYANAIVDCALSLAGSLEQLKQTDENKLARAYCYYRAARALIHLESEGAADKQPIQDAQKHESRLLGIYTQLVNLVGPRRPEFILLEIRMLRRDSWYGTALIFLEESAEVIDRKWYLNQRRELLTDLQWNQPAREAATIASNFESSTAVRDQPINR